jgi:hypothetical protein
VTGVSNHAGTTPITWRPGQRLRPQARREMGGHRWSSRAVAPARINVVPGIHRRRNTDEKKLSRSARRQHVATVANVSRSRPRWR